MAITLKKTQIVDSKLTPGVSFEVLTVTHGMRMKMELEVLEANAAAREYTHEVTKRLKGKDQNDPETLKAVATLQLLDKQARLPILIRTAMIAVHGISDEAGNPIAVDAFIDLAPSDLIEEAFAACEAACGLSPEERKNFESPSTSGSPVDRETNATTATSA